MPVCVKTNATGQLEPDLATPWETCQMVIASGLEYNPAPRLGEGDVGPVAAAAAGVLFIAWLFRLAVDAFLNRR